MIQQTLSLPRFRQLSKAHFAERSHHYLWFFAVIAMIYFFVLLLVTSTNETVSYETVVQMIWYYFGLISTGYVFALRYFANMARPESALIQLMQPASTFEKWLLATIMIIVVYPIIYTLLFLLMTYPVSALSMQDHAVSQAGTQAEYQLFIPLFSYHINTYTKIYTLAQLPVWIAYLAISGYALTTSLLFKKLPMIKSVALGFCLFLLFLLCLINIDNRPDKLFFYWFIDVGSPNHLSVVFANIILWIIVPLLLWAASFWALKERDLV